MDIHTSTTQTSNGWYGGVRYDTPNGVTHGIGRHGWPSETDADRYARELAKLIEANSAQSPSPERTSPRTR